MTVIRVIDFETTGFEPDSEVIEFGYCDYDVETKDVGQPNSELFMAREIPPEARATHHIRVEDIPENSPPFSAFEHVIEPADAMAITFFAAHNAKFEMQFLGDMEHRRMICTWKASLRVWPDAPSHSNMALRYWLEDQGKISLDQAVAYPAHRAAPDAYVTAHILRALFEDGATGKEMVAWTRDYAHLPTCPIGDPWRGKKWSDVDYGFLTWVANKNGMDEEIKWNAIREIDRRSQS